MERMETERMREATLTPVGVAERTREMGKARKL